MKASQALKAFSGLIQPLFRIIPSREKVDEIDVLAQPCQGCHNYSVLIQSNAFKTVGSCLHC